MQESRLRARYRRLMAFFIRVALTVALWELILPRLGFGGFARRTRSARYKRIAAQYRALAIQLGGVMIKVGQFLSARLDVLPVEITEELSGLQDEVPAEDFVAIRALAEAELGGSLDERFAYFESTPLAAASLGQVHRARLRSDATGTDHVRDVVVKIQRPFVDRLIDVDFSALRRFGGWLQRYPPIRRRVDVLALIEELSGVVHREIDYIQEGKNAEAFRANFAGRKRVRVPRVVWSHTTVRVLTLENVYAIKITDYEAITAAGIDRAEVAATLFSLYLKQIFVDRFFHADPHPGNLFVSPVPAKGDRKPSWRLTFVDFGMVGSVPEHLQDALRDLVVAVGTRNSAKVIQAYQALGMLLPGADLQLLERAEAQFFDRFWGLSMSELRKVGRSEMREYAVRFRELLYAMPFQLPHDLLLLGRTLAILSGMCTGLDPGFNPWRQLEPYARQMLTDEALPNWQSWLDQLGDLFRELIALPSQANRVLARLEQGELSLDMPSVNRQIYHLEIAVNRLLGGLVFAAFLFAGVLLYRDGAYSPAYVFWAFSAASLLWIVFLARGHSA